MWRQPGPADLLYLRLGYVLLSLEDAVARRASLERTIEWLLRRETLRAAEAALHAVAPSRRLALDQARLLLEVARRIAEPAESLPRGSRPAVLLDMYRGAVTWALRAEAEDETAPLGKLWDGAPAERLHAAAGGVEGVTAIRELLVNPAEPPPLDLLDSSVTPVRRFAEALVSTIDDPEQKVERAQIQRWTRLALVTAVVCAVVLGTPYLLRGPDLASSRSFKLSSVYGDCNARGKCGDLMFHTQFENNPWIVLDLGELKTVRSVEAKNRTDCCAERAVPLVIELGKDHRKFREVARRDSDFTTFRASFPAEKARYVRLRSPRHTALHLETVTVR